MKIPYFYRILAIILLALTVSCAPQAFLERSPTPTTASSSMPSPTAPAEPARASASTSKEAKTPQGGSDASQGMNFAIPAYPYSLILGRPTDTSIVFSLLSATGQTVAISYGMRQAIWETTLVDLSANQPAEIELSNLQPSTEYFYTVNESGENTFHTARTPGSTFTFTIQADSHLDSNTDPWVYLQTLANQRADHPDFVIDLGDTFMTDKYKPYTDAASQYQAQRYFLGQLGAPLYLVLGNHDGEGAPRGQDGAEMWAWALQQRTSLFPNPIPDAFYSGNATLHPESGPWQDYYAWEWGDALFIVLDPYGFTPPLGNDSSLWANTLGEAQYQWLKSTLEASQAKWKFVFIHQLLSGTDQNGRGGVEVANFYEWGGKNPDGSDGFTVNRPGWVAPIHPLLAQNHVSAIFHGHDHLFVKQELDGILYQECPQPGAARADTHSAAEYGYLSGDILPSPGYIRVTVGPDAVNVAYIRSDSGQAAYSYTIQP